VVTVRFILGCTGLPLIRQKNYLVARNRRPPGVDVDAADAEYFDGPSALKDIETPENHLFGEELKKVVQDAIKALPEDLRSALSLREFDGLSYEDIASVMDCPVGTVRSRIFRAREAVDMRIKAQIGGEEVEI
jgi:RNA polymerase sigma-70 factor (ECF subfamily)